MDKRRLDTELVRRGMVSTRSQAESYIKLGKVFVNDRPATKAGLIVGANDKIKLNILEQFVSRAGLKLAGVTETLKLDFRNKIVLDVGSSTGGFTDYALQHGVKKVIAVDVGTDQMHPRLRADERVELHEKTDIRKVTIKDKRLKINEGVVIGTPDIVLIDVSFISLRAILPHVSSIVNRQSLIVAMVKPQFEAGQAQVNKGVIKNDRVRRDILKDFELWAKPYFVIIAKADSQIAGAKGNLERFYNLKKIK